MRRIRCYGGRHRTPRSITAGEAGRPTAINPLAYTETVIRNFLRYQLTTYGFADAQLNRQLRELLSLDETRETPLRKGPYVSLSRAFKGGAAIAELVAEGVLHPHLKQPDDFVPERRQSKDDVVWNVVVEQESYDAPAAICRATRTSMETEQPAPARRQDVTFDI